MATPFACSFNSDHCRTERVLPPSDHYCIETITPSDEHYCIDIVLPSSDHCCTETVPPSSDHYGTTKVAPPTDRLRTKITSQSKLIGKKHPSNVWGCMAPVAPLCTQTHAFFYVYPFSPVAYTVLLFYLPHFFYE